MDPDVVEQRAGRPSEVVAVLREPTECALTRIEKVTPEQVRTVAKKYFAPENQTIVVVGDPKALGEQLKPFGEFTVTEK